MLKTEGEGMLDTPVAVAWVVVTPEAGLGGEGGGANNGGTRGAWGEGAR